jgi:formiminoglutamase
MRGYMAEPEKPSETDWPTPIDPDPAIGPVLRQAIAAALDFAKG